MHLIVSAVNEVFQPESGAYGDHGGHGQGTATAAAAMTTATPPPQQPSTAWPGCGHDHGPRTIHITIPHSAPPLRA